MSEYTKGPWKYVPRLESITGEPERGTSVIVCRMPEETPSTGPSRERHEANARLIALAPTMMGILRDIVFSLEDLTGTELDAGAMEGLIDTARDLLAKLDGES